MNCVAHLAEKIEAEIHFRGFATLSQEGPSPGTSPGMTWNDLRAPNKSYDNPSAFNASCTFGRAFMRSMNALTFGKGERSNSTRGAQRVTV